MLLHRDNGDRAILASAIGRLLAPVKLRDECRGLRLRLPRRDPGLQPADQCNDVAPVAALVQAEGSEDLHVRTRREGGTKIKTRGEDADDGHRRVINGYSLIQDARIAVEL